jgi:hypothetical protein
MKGGRLMSSSPLPSLREDRHNFFRYCERLLVATALAPDNSPFSPEELRRICFYANEVAKLADAQRLHEHSIP